MNSGTLSEKQVDRKTLERAARAAQELKRRQIKKECQTLAGFIKHFWHIVEPDREFVDGWALQSICQHLEAVSRGLITNLLMNVPPGFMKSLATDVFCPAWEWGALEKPGLRYVSFSYSSSLTERDNSRFARVIQSPLYKSLYPHVTFYPYALGMTKVANKQTGWKLASSVGGVGTGERGDRIIIDDPHNVKEAESEAVRNETSRWFRESITSRLNDPETSATVIIMQRVHEDDISGIIIDPQNGFNYTHLCIPMEYDPDRSVPTHTIDGEGFWTDPRSEINELAFPERFPRWVVDRDKARMGPSAVAAQFQQSPTVKGGNIIDRDWWQVWPAPGYEPTPGAPLEYPATSLRVGSVDTAYSIKETSAYNAMTVWGVGQNRRERPKAVLMEAGRARLPWRGMIPESAKPEPERKPYYGLVERVAETIRKRQLDIVLIENKTRGTDLANELSKLLRTGECRVILTDVAGDKVARLHAVQALFADRMVYAPDRQWADLVIDEVSAFPRGKYADLTDTTSQALVWLRQNGALLIGTEADAENAQKGWFKGGSAPFRYDV